MNALQIDDETCYLDSALPRIAVLESPAGPTPEELRDALWYLFGTLTRLRHYHEEILDSFELPLRRIAALVPGARTPEPLRLGLAQLAEDARAYMANETLYQHMKDPARARIWAMFGEQAKQQELLNRFRSPSALLHAIDAGTPHPTTHWHEPEWKPVLITTNWMVDPLVVFQERDFTIARFEPGRTPGRLLTAYSLRACRDVSVDRRYVELATDQDFSHRAAPRRVNRS